MSIINRLFTNVLNYLSPEGRVDLFLVEYMEKKEARARKGLYFNGRFHRVKSIWLLRGGLFVTLAVMVHPTILSTLSDPRSLNSECPTLPEHVTRLGYSTTPLTNVFAYLASSIGLATFVVMILSAWLLIVGSLVAPAIVSARRYESTSLHEVQPNEFVYLGIYFCQRYLATCVLLMTTLVAAGVGAAKLFGIHLISWELYSIVYSIMMVLTIAGIVYKWGLVLRALSDDYSFLITFIALGGSATAMLAPLALALYWIYLQGFGELLHDVAHGCETDETTLLFVTAFASSVGGLLYAWGKLSKRIGVRR